MKTIVVYESQTGFTRRYAHWIAEATGAECLPLSEARKKSMDTYEAIVFGGWACAGSISKLKWFKGHIDQWADKKLIAFCVGASPIDYPEIVPVLQQSFTEAQRKKVSVFYCPGGFNYEKMSLPSKLMMKLFIQALKAKRNQTAADKEMRKMISASYDLSDRKYIQPILECLKR